MLTRNNQPYEIKEEEARELLERFNRFPIILKYLPTMYSVDYYGKKRNTLSLSLPLVSHKMTSSGIETWRYYENVTARDKMGEPIGFSPNALEVMKTHVIASDENRINIELLYFLAKCSPYIENSENRDPNIMPSLAIEEKAKDAAKRVAEKREKEKINRYLYGESLTQAQKTLIAKAMGISVSPSWTEDELIEEIDKVIGVKKNATDFFRLIEDKYLTEIRASIQDAVMDKVIVFETTKRTWNYIGDKGKPADLICRVAYTETLPINSLAEFFLANKESFKMFERQKKGIFVTHESESQNDNTEEPVATPNRGRRRN